MRRSTSSQGSFRSQVFGSLCKDRRGLYGLPSAAARAKRWPTRLLRSVSCVSSTESGESVPPKCEKRNEPFGFSSAYR